MAREEVAKRSYDSAGVAIKKYDVLRNDETGEVALVVQAKNASGVEGLAVTNKVIGSGDWLDVYPDGVWTVVGNAGEW